MIGVTKRTGVRDLFSRTKIKGYIIYICERFISPVINKVYKVVQYIPDKLYEIYSRNREIKYVSIHDILGNGSGRDVNSMSVSQYIIASRYLYAADRNANRRWADIMPVKNRLGKWKDEKYLLAYFDNVISSVRRGIIPDFGFIVCSREPLEAADGSHRLGILCVDRPKELVPVKFSTLRPRYYLQHIAGRKWCEGIGLSEEEISQLEETFASLLKTLRRYLICVVTEDRLDKILAFLSRYGEVSLPAHIGRIEGASAQKYIQALDAFYIYRVIYFIPHEFRYYYSKGRIRLKVIDDIKKEMANVIGFDWEKDAFFSNSVTEALKMEFQLMEKIYK